MSPLPSFIIVHPVIRAIPGRDGYAVLFCLSVASQPGREHRFCLALTRPGNVYFLSTPPTTFTSSFLVSLLPSLSSQFIHSIFIVSVRIRSGLRRDFNLSVQANINSSLRKMKAIFYLFMAAIRFSNAQIALTASIVLLSAQAIAASSTSAPLGNAAVWQQAVILDAVSNVTGSLANRNFYSSIASWQSFENSSNSYLAGSPASIDVGPYWSQVLQNLQIYPTRFNQSQASNPQASPSKEGPDSDSSSMI